MKLQQIFPQCCKEAIRNRVKRPIEENEFDKRKLNKRRPH